ncbi:putative ATP-dependent RNA helicase DDX10-like 3, partial [Homarus americanus]
IKKKKEKAKRSGNKEDEEEGEEEEKDDDQDDDSDVDDVTQNIIDELPDPDKYYSNDLEDGEEINKYDSHSSDGESSSEVSESEEEEMPKISGKRRARDRAREAKRARLEQANTLEALPMNEQEELALFLLRGKT